MLGSSAMTAPMRRHQSSAVTMSTVVVPSRPAVASPVPAGAMRSPAADRARAVPSGIGWRLTDRGIAVVLMLFALLMTASLVVVVDKALTVTSPDSGYAATR